jgi:hypothetical protein
MPLSTRGIYREVVSGAFDENDSHGTGHPNPNRVDLNTVLVRFESIVCEGSLCDSSMVLFKGVLALEVWVLAKVKPCSTRIIQVRNRL